MYFLALDFEIELKRDYRPPVTKEIYHVNVTHAIMLSALDQFLMGTITDFADWGDCVDADKKTK